MALLIILGKEQNNLTFLQELEVCTYRPRIDQSQQMKLVSHKIKRDIKCTNSNCMEEKRRYKLRFPGAVLEVWIVSGTIL